MTGAAGALVACAGLLTACGPPAESSFDAPHVHLLYPPAAPPCPGSAAFLDDAATALAGYLGLGLPAEPIPYHFTAGGPVPAGCPGAERGCAGPDGDGRQAVWSPSAVSVHELVHTLVQAHTPSAPAFLNEGIAVALGERAFEGAPVYDAVVVRNLAAASALDAEGYRVAGDLASFLLDTRGPAPVLALLAAAAGLRDAAAIDAAFTAVLGEGLEALVAERLASGRAYPGSRLAFPECAAGPLVALDGASRPLDLACARGAAGPDDGARVFRRERIEAPAGASLLVGLRGDALVETRAHRCGAGAGLDMPLAPVGATVPGVITAVFAGAADSPQRVWIEGSIARDAAPPAVAAAPAFAVTASTTSAAGGACDPLVPLVVEEARSTVAILPATGATAYLALRAPASTEATLAPVDADVALCAPGCAAAVCSSAVHQTLDPTAIHVLDAASKSPAAAVSVVLSGP